MDEEREEEGKRKIQFECSFARRYDDKEGEEEEQEEGKEAKIEVIVEIKPNKVKRARGTRKQSNEANKSKTRCKAQIESANK